MESGQSSWIIFVARPWNQKKQSESQIFLRHFSRPRQAEEDFDTLDPTKTRQAGETEMRYAPAGYKFSIPLNDILMAKGLDLSWAFTSPCPNCPWFRVDEIQCDYACWAWHLMVGSCILMICSEMTLPAFRWILSGQGWIKGCWLGVASSDWQDRQCLDCQKSWWNLHKLTSRKE